MSDDPMQQMMEAAEPGPEHERLRQFVGEWKATVEHRHAPDAAPSVTEGRMVNTLEHGGRFLRQQYRGAFGEHDFHGTGYWGYNNLAMRYEGMWIDDMSTSLSTDAGPYDAESNSWTMEGTDINPQTGRPMERRSIIRVLDEDRHVMSMNFRMDPGADYFEAMKITYERVR